MSDFMKRFTSRPFLMTLGGAISAVGLGVAAVSSKDVPADQKIQAVMAAFGAVTVLIGTFTHAETKKDGVVAAANIASQAVATPDIGEVVKAELVRQLGERVSAPAEPG